MQEQRQSLIMQEQMTSRPLLTFGFSILAERVKNLIRPDFPKEHDVMALVQNPNQISYVLDLPKVKLVELKSIGVAKSRNAALQHANGEYLIFGDDDISFKNEGILNAIEYFQSHPECSIILAQAVDEDGNLRKRYESKVTPLKLSNSARAATYEMIVRVDAIRNAKINFDENFGAGAENYLGDEYIFIADALRAGLKGVHLPVVVAIHPKESSGSRWGNERDLRARAAIFTRVFGAKAPLMRLAFLIKTNNPKPSPNLFIRFVFNRFSR